MMTHGLLKVISKKDIRDGKVRMVDQATLSTVREIVDDVIKNGEPALRRWAERFGDIEKDAPLLIEKEQIARAKDQVSPLDLSLLERTADRIAQFARAQRKCLIDLETQIEGGRAGHSVVPLERAGCYAPGGRFPLPSSVLMTAVTAVEAGVEQVILASPKPAPITLAAAAVAGVDRLLSVGGAQAIAAMAFGAGDIMPCDIVVGPGNRFVTAAKQLIFGQSAIDMLAGPSELLVVADKTSDPSLVAADLLAQAEHDPDAVPILLTTEEALINKVLDEIRRQLSTLETRDVARLALQNGFVAHVDELDEAIEISNRLAPEHLALHLAEPDKVVSKCRHYGGLFIGSRAGEVLGDYGAGPNHTLPTGGTARYTGGLSVLNFLKVRTWMKIEDKDACAPLLQDAQRLGELEGLFAHARSANKRLSQS